MSGFHETRLPLAIAFGASGGPERSTEVVRLASGAESRNARWAGSRRRWDVGGATMRLNLAHELAAFFEARRGRLFAFRFRDPLDWKSCPPGDAIAADDQPLGVGDGETQAFQLVKVYASGGEMFERHIRKPVEEAVLVAIDGEATSAFSVDLATGIVTFDTPPPEDAVLTAGFEFDTPVRFDGDRLEMAMVGHDAARVMRAQLIETAG
jgi:uncharacterized protein (TIGR02217 family)